MAVIRDAAEMENLPLRCPSIPCVVDWCCEEEDDDEDDENPEDSGGGEDSDAFVGFVLFLLDMRGLKVGEIYFFYFFLFFFRTPKKKITMAMLLDLIRTALLTCMPGLRLELSNLDEERTIKQVQSQASTHMNNWGKYSDQVDEIENDISELTTKYQTFDALKKDRIGWAKFNDLVRRKKKLLERAENSLKVMDKLESYQDTIETNKDNKQLADTLTRVNKTLSTQINSYRDVKSLSEQIEQQMHQSEEISNTFKETLVVNPELDDIDDEVVFEEELQNSFYSSKTSTDAIPSSITNSYIPVQQQPPDVYTTGLASSSSSSSSSSYQIPSTQPRSQPVSIAVPPTRSGTPVSYSTPSHIRTHSSRQLLLDE